MTGYMMHVRRKITLTLVMLISLSSLTGLYLPVRAETVPQHLQPIDAVQDAKILESTDVQERSENQWLWEYWQTVALADLDGDRILEIIVLLHEMDNVMFDGEPFHSGILARGSEGYRYVARFSGSATNYDPELLDLNGDGIQDLMYETSAGGNSFSSHWNCLVW